MRKLAHLLSGFFLILVFAASITFSYFNPLPVTIIFGNWEFSPLPVSVWIIGAFVCGGLIGLLLGLGLFRNIRSRTENKRLKKKLEGATSEANKLRAMTLKDL